MGNRNQNFTNNVNQQQQVRAGGQGNQSTPHINLFQRFSNIAIGPKSSYAIPVNKHLVLGQSSLYTLHNLDSIIGRNVSSRYPKGEGQIYNIKQYNATYQGSFNNGLPSGKGVAYFKDGGYYSGDFIDGDANGNGIYIYPNGSVYQGQFAQSLYNGSGILIYADQRMKYEGNFSNGLPEGPGKEIYANGSYYEGEFRQGQKHGQGIYQWANGQRYEGSWINGLMHGKGVLRDSQKIIFQGEFIKGLKNGYGVYQTREGTYEGNFQSDKLNGSGSFIWNDGKIYEGNFVNSMMHGSGTLYYPSNQVARGQWMNNHNQTLYSVQNNVLASQKIKQIRMRHEAGSGNSTLQTIRKDDTQNSQRLSEHFDNSFIKLSGSVVHSYNADKNNVYSKPQNNNIRAIQFN